MDQNDLDAAWDALPIDDAIANAMDAALEAVPMAPMMDAADLDEAVFDAALAAVPMAPMMDAADLDQAVLDAAERDQADGAVACDGIHAMYKIWRRAGIG
jgi:hypothetical protein